jgi:hypothetical protein
MVATALILVPLIVLVGGGAARVIAIARGRTRR